MGGLPALCRHYESVTNNFEDYLKHRLKILSQLHAIASQVSNPYTFSIFSIINFIFLSTLKLTPYLSPNITETTKLCYYFILIFLLLIEIDYRHLKVLK